MGMQKDSATYRDLSVTLHNTDLYVFGTCLYNLQQTFDCQFDALFPRHVVLVVLLQKLSNCLARTTNSVGLASIVVQVYWQGKIAELTFHAL